MSALRLLTEVISKSLTVFITTPHHPLAAEISKQLSSHSDIKVLFTPSSGNVDIIVHLAGFDPPSLSETLSHTSSLHQLLNLAHAHNSKFILIIPKSQTSLHDVAVSLVTQFAKNFHLDYRILETDNLRNIPNLASTLIKIFVPHHISIPISIPPTVGGDTGVVSKTSRISFSWIPTALAIFLIPLIFLAIEIGTLALLLSCSINSYKSAHWRTLASCARSTEKVALFLKPQVSILPSTSAYIDPVVSLSRTLVIASRVGEKASSLVSSSDIAEISFYLSHLSESLADLHGILATSQTPKNFSALSPHVASARTLINKINFLLPQLPDLLSLNATSKYLILIQDNTELRPTGGFLGQFALVTVENGHIVDTQILDTFSTDSQLHGQIDPPPDLKTALGESNWFFRDANWDPDFRETARRAIWFTEKELSVSPDHVIAINLSLYLQLLSITGPINGVDSKNFYSQYLARIKPDSSQPNFLVELSQEILNRLKSPTSDQTNRLISLIISSLDSRQIFIYSPSSQPRLNVIGWSGGLISPLCRSALTCVNDYIYQVDANVGINKADAFINRQTSVLTTLAPKTVNSILKITYTNTSTQNAWPSGTYKNYLRLYLPPDSQIDSVSLPYSISPQHGFLALGAQVEVSPNTSTLVEVKYHRPLPDTQRFHYQLDFSNQPGVSPYPVTVTINYPRSWFTTTVQQPSLASAGSLQYNFLLSRPLQVDADFINGN